MSAKIEPKAIETPEDKKKQAYWVGIVVLILLTTFTVGEFFVGYFASLWWAPLLFIAALKARPSRCRPWLFWRTWTPPRPSTGPA